MATIKVWAADENVRKRLKHPFGMAFREDIGEGVDWPDDLFTRRRIGDGSVRTQASETQQPAHSPSPVDRSSGRKEHKSE